MSNLYFKIRTRGEAGDYHLRSSRRSFWIQDSKRLDKTSKDLENPCMLKNPLRRYQLFLGLEVVVVLLIILNFRLIPDRTTAGVTGGMIFLLSTLFILIAEWIQVRRVSWAFAGALIFFFGGVIPILTLRFLSWGEPFDQAQIMGVSGGFLHRSSNLLFFLLLIGIFISLQKARWEHARNRK